MTTPQQINRINELVVRMLDSIYPENDFTEIFNALSQAAVAVAMDYVVKSGKELTVEELNVVIERFASATKTQGEFLLVQQGIGQKVKDIAEGKSAIILPNSISQSQEN